MPRRPRERATDKAVAFPRTSRNRRNGPPIFPVLGASDDEISDSGDQTTAVPPGTLHPPAKVTLDQDELSRRFTREKDQGRRAGARELLSPLGFDSPRLLTDFVGTQRDVEQSRLSDLDRREQELTAREAHAVECEAAAATPRTGRRTPPQPWSASAPLARSRKTRRPLLAARPRTRRTTPRSARPPTSPRPAAPNSSAMSR